MEFDTVPEVVEQNPAVGIGESNDVNAADLLVSEASDTSAQSNAQPQTDAPAQTQTNERKFTSDDMSKAVQNRLKQERRGAAYQLGRELLDERMRAENISEAEALAKIREDRLKSKAAEFKANPEKGYMELMRQRYDAGEDARSPEARVERVFDSITNDIQSGKVPQGFDLNAYLSEPNRAREFVDLYEKLGMEQTCAIVMRFGAQQTPADVNRSLPKPINTNNSYTPATPDIWGMSSEDFAKMEQKMKTARAQGKRVNF